MTIQRTNLAGATASATDTVIVADAPVSGSLVTVTATAQSSFSSVVAEFSDSNPGAAAGDFSATIDWGDGTVGPGTVSSTNGTFQVTGSHLYARSGSETLVLTVNDVGGQSVTVNSTATIVAQWYTARAVCGGGL